MSKWVARQQMKFWNFPSLFDFAGCISVYASNFLFFWLEETSYAIES